MKIFDRLIVFTYSILAILTSFIVMVLPLDIKSIIGIDETIGFVRLMKGNYSYTIIGLILLLLNFIFLFSQFKNKEVIDPGAYLVLKNDLGEIMIYQDTIIGLVNNIASKFNGIINIKTRVIFNEGKIILFLKGEANEEINVPETSLDLQTKVKEHIESVTGALVKDIKVEIMNVSSNKIR